MLLRLPVAALSLLLAAAPPSEGPLPRLAEPPVPGPAAPAWPPPVPEQVEAEADSPPPDAEGAAGWPTPVVREADPAPKTFSRAPLDLPADEGDDTTPIDWRIGQRRRSHTNYDATLSFGLWPSSINGGLWFAMPLLKRGLIDGINDALFLEFGALFLGSYLWDAIAPPQFDILPAVGLRWDFFMTKMVTLFGTAKLGPRIGAAGRHRVYPDPVLGVGTVLNLSRRAHLRLELGYPAGFSAALSVPFGAVND